MAKNLLSILSFHPTNTAILKSSSNEPDSTFNHNLYVYSCVFVFECVCSFVDLCVSECESLYVLVFQENLQNAKSISLEMNSLGF